MHAIVDLVDNPPRLVCAGREDTATRLARRASLSRALGTRGDLVVDLRDLSSADASLFVDLAVVAQRVRRAGHGLRLVDPQPNVRALVELMGVHRMPGVTVEETVAT